MIVTTGKPIKVDVGTWNLHMSCSAEVPGAVYLRGPKGALIELPANPGEAQKFIDAYKRIIAEDVGYRKVESGSDECNPLTLVQPTVDAGLIPNGMTKRRLVVEG